jgi:hypothetical protein
MAWEYTFFPRCAELILRAFRRCCGVYTYPPVRYYRTISSTAGRLLCALVDVPVTTYYQTS